MAEMDVDRFASAGLDWERAERWYVEGELGPDGRRFPTLSKLARLLGVSRQAVHQRAKREGWAGRRGQPVRAYREEAPGLPKLDVRGAQDPMAIIDRWLALFTRALDENRVPRNGVQELAAAIKLKQHLLDETKERAARTELPSLEELQVRHQSAVRLRREIELHPELAGIVSSDRDSA